MGTLSDIIEEFIKELLKNNEEKQLQIQRNELANYFSCAPSQINYVLTTRFTTDKGYYVESKRGGGGCIIIKHVALDQYESLLGLLNKKIDNSITFDKGARIIDSLLESDIINYDESRLMKVAINDRTLMFAIENRNKVRADILKNMIYVCFT